MLVGLLICLSAVVINGLPLMDEVHSLPGLNGPLSSRWFSGYLDGGKKDDGTKLVYHYLFLYSESENPENDDVVLWTNGGPGASSIFGLMTELGPYYVSSESLLTKDFKDTGIPTLFKNNFGWNKLANILVLSGPPPVSFGYCDPPGPSGTGFQCGEWNDTSTAHANYNFIESFYKKFPEFANNDLYLTGESYAGIYVPTLAREILKRTPEESVSRKNLKGFAVGDGCVGTDILCSGASGGKWASREWFYKAKFLYGHGQFSTKLYKKIEKYCDEENPQEEQDQEDCGELYTEMNRQVGGYFDYNLYDECWDAQSLPTMESIEEMKIDPLSLSQNQNNKNVGTSEYPCGGGGVLAKWLGTSQVKNALNLKPNSKFVSGDNSEALNYKLTEKSLLDFYYHLATETDLRVLIYSGDTDPTINSFISEKWVTDLNLKEISPWSPWTLDGKTKVVGYVTRYHNNFDFLTIRGSGHMVPQMKPQAAYEMLSQWLKNKPWKSYKK